jgi:hypothetical protein
MSRHRMSARKGSESVSTSMIWESGHPAPNSAKKDFASVNVSHPKTDWKRDGSRGNSDRRTNSQVNSTLGAKSIAGAGCSRYFSP